MWVYLTARTVLAGLVTLGLVVSAWRKYDSGDKDAPYPPGSLGLPVVGEILQYVLDPAGFIVRRYEQHGPVFKSNVFFRPMIFVGGPKAIEAFLKVEKQCSRSSLPWTFVELHSKYSLLNLHGAEHRSARGHIVKALRGLRESFAELADAAATDHLRQRPPAAGTALMPWIKAFSLDLNARMFLGGRMPAGFDQLFHEFNDGLLALIPFALPGTAFGRGMNARARIIEHIQANIPDDDGLVGECTFFSSLLGCRDESGQPWSREKVSYAGLLFTWGSHFEIIALISNVMYMLAKHPDVIDKAREEAIAVVGDGALTAKVAGRLKYLDAVCKESLRLMPPTGGGFRIMETTEKVMGYTFPKGWVVSVDPRITAVMPDVFENGFDFDPDRFTTEASEKLPPHAFTPGGVGTHTCPGIPTGLLVSKIFLARLLLEHDWAITGEPGWTQLPFKMITDDYTVEFTGAKSKSD